jgi:hypothetical protein
MEGFGLHELTFDLDTEGVQVLAAPRRKAAALVGEGVLQTRRHRRRAGASSVSALAHTTGG